MRPAPAVLVLYLTRLAHLASPLLSVHPYSRQGMNILGTRRSICPCRGCWKCAGAHADSSTRARGHSVPELYLHGQNTALDDDNTSNSGSKAETLSRPREHVSAVADDESGEEALSNRRLHEVVAQLQGDIREGSSPDARSREELDSLFQRLPSPSQMLDDESNTVVAARHQDASAMPSLRALINVEEQAVFHGTNTSELNTPSLPILNVTSSVCNGGAIDGWGSMPTKLAQLQSVAQVSRERAEPAEVNNLAGGDTQFLTTLTATKLQIMRTRLECIRRGRVSWAVLPLLLRARNSGIILTTSIYNVALAAYKTTPSKYPDALRVLDLMRNSEGLEGRPDVTSYNIAMRVCGDGGNWRIVFEVSV